MQSMAAGGGGGWNRHRAFDRLICTAALLVTSNVTGNATANGTCGPNANVDENWCRCLPGFVAAPTQRFDASITGGDTRRCVNICIELPFTPSWGTPPGSDSVVWGNGLGLVAGGMTVHYQGHVVVLG
jgi:hypothetical protein